MNSMFTLSTLVGMSVSHLTRGTIIANLGFRDAISPAPMFQGNTLYGDSTVLHLRRSGSRQNAGIATLQHVSKTQDNVVVAVAVRLVLMLRSPGDTDARR
jgi:acyl dehydratase